MTEELRTVLTLVGSGLIAFVVSLVVARFTVKLQLRVECDAREEDERKKEEARLKITDIEAWLLERISAGARVWQPMGEGYPSVNVDGRKPEPSTKVLEALESLDKRRLVRRPSTRSERSCSMKTDGDRALERYRQNHGLTAGDPMPWKPSNF